MSINLKIPAPPPDGRHVTINRDFSYALDASLLAHDLGFAELDAWQLDLLTGDYRKVILNIHRQGGKSTVTALVCLHTMLFQPGSLTVVGSPSQKQSTELFRKLHGFWQRLPWAPKAMQENLTSLTLENGSRLVSLPGSESTTRGYSAVDLLVVDEASRVPDEVFSALRPSQATKRGARLFLLSTPAGRRGHFFNVWTNNDPSWHRILVTADNTKRITPEFLLEQRAEMSEPMYQQEYFCRFVDDESSAFNSELIAAALSSDIKPLWGNAA